ncbi:MAG: PorP/SprF family type IX secretion system membrane protein [Saprospiraceae bacterium]|nr:PorP/SprF family type IX secretion system membrane protein [Saprospiraceae bacterium]
MIRTVPALVLTVLLASAGVMHAQDLHYSQFYHNPMHHNPALTGIFEGQWRAAAQYRSQWTSVPVSYSTFSASFDNKVIRRGSNMLSVGLNLQHDQAGDAKLSWTQGGLQVSAAHALGERHAISVGFGLAAAQRSFDITALKFQNQWNGEVYDPNLATQENFNKNSGISPTLSAGLNWHFQAEETRTRFDLGAGAFHLNRPNVAFLDDNDVELPMRLAVQTNVLVQVGASSDLVFYGLQHIMGEATESILGLGVRQILSMGPGNFTAVQLSAGMREGDAIIPALQIERNNWTVGLSYDINTSEFDVATNGRGGFEVAVIYRHLPVPPVKTFKACPIF